jgi:hypothetical protein
MELWRKGVPLREIPICITTPICQRCQRCIVHCLCPPPAERATTDEWKRNGRGNLVLKS